MPENLTNRNKCHKCHKTGERKKDKLSKCSICHSITYCSQECQEADWDRHKPNCVPVMVKEYGVKGTGLVASRDIEMGEQILVDKPVIKWGLSCLLPPDAERCLINQEILKEIFLLNHSCAPNAAIGLTNPREPEKSRIELRAIKDISKNEEVTIFYPIEIFLPWLHADMRQMIHEDYGFDCKCPVCSGEVPNQDDIMEKMMDIFISSGISSKDEDERTLSDWTREAIGYGAMIELSKPLYIGRPDLMMKNLQLFRKAACKARKQALIDKAVDEIRELVKKTGLEAFKVILHEISVDVD